MKKVLILTASTGAGHNQAANSISETFSKNNYECITLEFLKSKGNFLNEIIVKGYEILASSFPNFYGSFYKFTDSKKINNFLRIVFKLASFRLNKKIKEIAPDIIIGTHPMSVTIISILKHKGLNIPFISIVTDFEAHYTYIDECVDSYITGSISTKDSLISKGILASKIYPIGIPIKRSFFNNNPIISSLKDNEYLSILLMGGSMGLSKISFVLEELLKNPSKIRITVVCGNNTKLEHTLINKCDNTEFKNKKIHILGYTTDIAYLMEYSDIIITKPGGLTISESIVKNIPIIIPFVIPGQEMENTEFLVSKGIAIYAKDLKNINSIVNNLSTDEHLLNKMKTNIKLLSSTYDPDRLVTISENLIKEYSLVNISQKEALQNQ